MKKVEIVSLEGKTTVLPERKKKKDFRAKEYYQKQKGNFIMMKWSIHQEVIIIINVSVPTNRGLNTMKNLTELKD